MNIFKKIAVEYRYSQVFLKYSKWESIKYTCKNLFKKDKSIKSLYDSVEQATKRIRLAQLQSRNDFIVFSSEQAKQEYEQSHTIRATEDFKHPPLFTVKENFSLSNINKK